MKVRKLPVDPGPAGWNAILDAAPAPTPLEGAHTADWLIIGAGFAGLAAARRLTQVRPGDRIALLDAVRVGDGPAGRNSGFMIDLPHDLASENYGGAHEKDRATTAANRAAIDFAAAAALDYEMPDEAFRRSGKVNAAITDRGLTHNKDFAGHLTALGEAHETLDAAQMQELTGTSCYQGGLFTPGAAMIQPAMFVRAMAAGVQAAGAALHEMSPVLTLSRTSGAWRATTPGGPIEAPRVILAVNGHAESFGHFRRRLMHVFTYASMTRRLTPNECAALGGAPDWGVTPADPMGTTVRRISGAGGDRIVIRNRFTYDPSMEASAARLAAVGKDHDRAFAARFPMLNGVTMEHRWGGRLCLSRNDAPAFGEVEEGLFIASCQNGLGTAKGTFAGVAAADLARGADTDFTRYMAAQPAPVKLPPEPFAWLGANAYMRWKEHAAGPEL